MTEPEIIGWPGNWLVVDRSKEPNTVYGPCKRFSQALEFKKMIKEDDVVSDNELRNAWIESIAMQEPQNER